MINIFIAYNQKDKEKLNNLVENLNSLKNCWRLLYYQPAKSDKSHKEDFLESLINVYFFVVLISDNSLNSKYVQSEISEAIRLCKLGNIKKICSLIIDDKIDSSDNRIPEYLNQNIFCPTSMKSAAQIIAEGVIYELSKL